MEDKYYNVPVYIEKDIKKLIKLREQEKELIMRINDYMKYHKIPKDTPFNLMKHFEEDETHPNQISIYESEKENVFN